ncbi:4-hydroxy-tetrahydrodipicolinate synthase [Atopococcus tabaci]|uniref:4-hydroxy-tetrahydrodipicolinate synthase n=1 Tax=Atopococcus tabaci TaxID=269774 RepID=UPI00240A10D1|nr:4-hydroxy-tetrahydrodipicolinate synthase [Atopococcus tabaci]
MSHLFKGIGVAVTAPFQQGAVDYEAFRNHLKFLIEQGSHSLVVNGTTGESSTLTDEEKTELLKIAVKTADGKIPVIAGTGSNNTAHSIAASKEAEGLGVDGLLLITPYYNKTSQKGLIAHFTAIADETNLPIILYNVPARTGMAIAPETVAELSKHPRIVGLKDATGDMNYLSQVKLLTDDSFAMYSGNDDSFLPFMSLGGDGIISVAANALPKEYVELYEASLTNVTKAQKLHYHLYPLVDALSMDVNPIPIKVLTSHLGYGTYELRLPLVPLEDSKQQQLIDAFNHVRGGN